MATNGSFTRSTNDYYLYNKPETSFYSIVNPMLSYFYPIESIKERMTFQVTIGSSQPITRVTFIQQLSNQIFSRLHKGVARVFHKVGKLKIARHDLIVNFFHIFRINFNKRIFTG